MPVLMSEYDKYIEEAVRKNCHIDDDTELTDDTDFWLIYSDLKEIVRHVIVKVYGPGF